MARAQVAAERRRLPGEQIPVGAHTGPCRRGMGVGEPHGRQTEHEVGGDGHPQVPGRHRLTPRRPGRSHGGDHLSRLLRVGRQPAHPPEQPRLVQRRQYRVAHGEEGRLVAGRADEQWDPGRRAGRHCVLGRGRQQASVDHRHQQQSRVVVVGGQLSEFGGRPNQVVGPHLLEGAAGQGHAQVVGQLLGSAPRDLRRVGVGGPALHDGPVEEPLGRRHGQQGRHAHAAGRLAEQRHVSRVATEGGDVVVDPLQGGQLIGQPPVPEARPLLPVEPGLPRILQRRVGQEPEEPEPVVDGDHHHVVLASQHPAPVEAPGA